MTTKPKKRGGGIFYNIKNKKAFTLVELIIVVTIIAILSTVAFMSFGDYPSQARDTVRTSDFKTIQKALELYKIENGEYPEPKEISEKRINKEGFLGFIEGEIDEELGSKLNLAVIPKNPSDGTYYPYMVSNDKKTYILRVERENQGPLLVGDIPTSCRDIKEKNIFNGNGKYFIYHTELGPREVVCMEGENADFYDFILGGDMELSSQSGKNIVYKYGFDFPTNYVSLTTEKNFTEGGKYSLKILRKNTVRGRGLTYVDSSKDYKISGKFFLEPNGSTAPSRVYIGFISYDKNFEEIFAARVNGHKDTETYLTRDVDLENNKIYFYCDENIYNNWKKRLIYHSVIAYGTKENFPEIPVNKGDLSDYLYNNGTVSFPITKLSDTECSLGAHKSFKLSKKTGTKIRLHNSGAWYSFYSLNLNTENLSGKWVDMYMKITSKNKTTNGIGMDHWQKFRAGTVYVRPMIYANYIGDTISNNLTILYVDDVKLEVME